MLAGGELRVNDLSRTYQNMLITVNDLRSTYHNMLICYNVVERFHFIRDECPVINASPPIVREGQMAKLAKACD